MPLQKRGVFVRILYYDVAELTINTEHSRRLALVLVLLAAGRTESGLPQLLRSGLPQLFYRAHVRRN